MKIWIIITTVIGMTTVMCAAQAQIQHRISLRPPMTPVQKADFHRTAVLTRAATSAMRSGDYAEAEANARVAVATGYDAGFAQETLAAALDAQGKSQESLQAYKEIADEGGLFPRNLLPYALLLLKAGDVRQAALVYNKALPLIDNGDLMRKNGDFSQNAPHSQELAAAIHTALGLQSDWRGYHGAYQGYLQQSLLHFQQAAALEPSSPLTNYYYGYGLKRLGRGVEAQAAFRKAAALGQGDVREAAQKELPETVRPK